MKVSSAIRITQSRSSSKSPKTRKSTSSAAPLDLDFAREHKARFIDKITNDYPIDLIRTQYLIDIEAEKRELATYHDGLMVIEYLRQQPFTAFTELRDHLQRHLSGKIDKAIKLMENKGHLKVRKAVKLNGKEANFMPLTESAQVKPNLHPSRFHHTMYMNHVKTLAQDVGCYVDIEHSATATTPTQDRIDVYLEHIRRGGIKRRIGVEVQLTIDRYQIIQNVTKCLYTFAVDEILVITENSERNKVKAIDHIIYKNIPSEEQHKIRVMTIKQFISEHRAILS